MTVAQKVVDVLLEDGSVLRTLRDLRAMPDDQLYLCSDSSVAERHKISVPFECGCRQWVSAGIVKIEFYSNREEYRVSAMRLQTSDYAKIVTLQPAPGKSWRFDDVPSF